MGLSASCPSLEYSSSSLFSLESHNDHCIYCSSVPSLPDSSAMACSRMASIRLWISSRRSKRESDASELVTGGSIARSVVISTLSTLFMPNPPTHAYGARHSVFPGEASSLREAGIHLPGCWYLIFAPRLRVVYPTPDSWRSFLVGEVRGAFRQTCLEASGAVKTARAAYADCRAPLAPGQGAPRGRSPCLDNS